MRGSSVSYNADNQISANTYDGDGNPISYKGNNPLRFDPEDRMSGYSSAQNNAYNGDDHRTKIDATGAVTYSRLYDAFGNVVKTVLACSAF